MHAVALAILALLCHGGGRAVMDALRIRTAGDATRAVVASGLGFGALGMILFACGSLGLLTRAAVLVVLALFALCAARYASELRSLIVRTPPGILLVLLGGSAVTFVRALYPPTGPDAGMYHLPFARLFAETGSLGYAETIRFPVFPQLNEVIFAAALLVADDLTAQLTQCYCMLVTAAAIVAMARGGERSRGGALAAAIWLGMPLVFFLGSQAYVDCGLTMTVTLAFLAWIEWRASDHAPAWAAALGAFTGMAAATKYHGLFFVAWFAVAILVTRARSAAAFAAALLVVGAPWYLRIAAWTGNPLFPYFTSLFGANDWGLNLDASRHLGSLTVPARNPDEWVLLNSHNVRLWILALAPPAIAGLFLDRRLRVPFAAAVAYAIAVWSLDTRFLIVTLPLFALGASVAVAAAVRQNRIVLAIAGALVLVGGHAANIRFDVRYLGPIPRTSGERHAFLQRQIAAYAAQRVIAGSGGAGKTIYALRCENAAYFWRGRYLGDWFGPYRYDRVVPFIGQPDRFAQILRGFGAEYLLVCDAYSGPLPNGLELLFTTPKARVYRIPSVH
ncbi:MAG TPA: glycosyltransferase family 39 protein [Thermoanaerobaculia bacterium]|nr:glycosyltransferase family 39 protein [Thermoanaerobaculia bacterium]